MLNFNRTLKFGRLIETIVFIVGFCVMSLEIISSRVLAPYLGTSVIAWTAIIGMILLSLSTGYFFGGKYADRKASEKRLGLILILASLYLFIFTLFNVDIFTFLANSIKDLRVLSLASTAVFLFPTNALLGAVAPYSIRLKLNSLKKTGRTAGNLYALSTLGSILGTFLTGYYLIAGFGIFKILVGISIVLFISSLFLVLKRGGGNIWLLLVLAILVVTGVFSKGESLGVYDISGFYNRIILETGIRNNRPVLILNTGRVGFKDGYEGIMFTDVDNDLVAQYTKYYRLADYFNPNLKTALMLGGGTYSYPKDFLKRNSKATLDVVEEDPMITAVAKDFFNLKDSNRLNIYHEEGRYYMENNSKKYDAIFLDLFKSDSSVPFQASTLEFLQDVNGSLSENGVVISNIASSVLGDNGKFLRAEYRTYKQIFPKVYLFLVNRPEDYYDVQNIMLVAFKSGKATFDPNADMETKSLLETMYKGQVPYDEPVLTDDYAPVESYLVLRQVK